MATYFARKTGNINATDVWATTPSGAAGAVVFTNSDVLISNSFTITVNVSTTVAEVRNDTTGGATAGGSFTLSNGVTLTANVYAGGSATALTYNGTSPNSASIIGSINGGSGSQTYGVDFNGNGTLNITGNIIGGSGSSSGGLRVRGGGTCSIVGNVTGGSGGNAYGINCDTLVSTVNITGTVTGNSTSTSGNGLNMSVAGTVTIVGSCVGGSATTGVVNASTGTIIATRAKGNGFGNGSVGLTAQVGVSASQNGATRVYEIEYGDLGQSPTSGPVQLIDASSNVCLVYRTGGLGKKTLIDSASSSGAFPSASNVRSGVSYNNGNTVGTMAVPSANSVNYGVSVDNTTGTAVLTPSGVWNHPVSSITTVGSIGERAKNCSTIASVGQQLANALSPK